MLINNFIIEIPELIKQLPNTLIAHDNEQISQQLHTIKGVVANLSGEIMHNTCKEIAVAIKANDPEKYQQLLSNLTVNYQTLVVKFNQYLQNSES